MSAKYLALVFFMYLTSTVGAEQGKQTDLPQCKACRLFVTSFTRGMKRTERGKFEGGDVAWEEEKLKPYKSSELRLTEIQEKLCLELKEGKDQCFALHEKYEADLEEWWFQKQDTDPDLFDHICIEKIKVCCPELHFGPDCTPCPGHPDKVCNLNGKCRGDGTRKGNGTCSCQSGYTGEMCNECANLYFASYKDEKKLLCSKCHASCDGGCFKAGPKGCQKCKSGWIMDDEKGCIDVNECAGTTPCTPLQFCVNTDGGFRCLECDKSCLGCTGDGPDMCNRCASGFTMQNRMCIDNSHEQRMNYVWCTRYITYVGLCIATCIIFQKNVVLSALIGLAVATYIYASEYMISTPPQPDTHALKEELNKMFN